MVSDSLPHPLLSSATSSDLAEVICVLNANGAIQFATPAAAQFFGYDMPNIIGRSALRFVDADTYSETIQRWGAMRDDPTNSLNEMHLTMVAANGRRIPIRATVWRLPSSKEFLLVLHLVEYLQDRLQTLYSILNNVSGRLAVSAVLDTVQREVFRLIPSSVCTVYVIESDKTVRIREYDQTHLRDYKAPLDTIFAFETTRIICDTGQPVIIADTACDPRGLALAEASPKRTIRSWLGVPLLHHDQFIGELNLDSPQPNAFTAQDAELALALAGQLASVVFHARQFEAEQRRSKRYSVLNDISQAISRLDLDNVLELVYRKLTELMDTSTFFIGLYDAEAETVQLVGGYDHGKKSPDILQRADAGITGQVLHARASLIVRDSRIEGLPNVRIVHNNEIPRSVLMMPLITQDELVGVISVQSYKPNAYAPEDVDMLNTIAGTVATAVRNARLYDQTVERFAALGTLHQLSMELATVQEPGEIAQRVTRAALNLLKASAIRLCVCDHVHHDDMQQDKISVWSAYAAHDPGPMHVESCGISALHLLLRQVHDTGQSVLIMDMAGEPVLQREFDTPWLVQAAAIYPIQRGDHLFAVLSLLYAEPTFFRQDMLRTLDLLALEAATAFQNARYLDTLRGQLAEVTALQDLARRISTLRSLHGVLATTVQALHAVYQCKSAWVALLDKERAVVSIAAAVGLDAAYMEKAQFKMGEYVVGHVVAAGEPVYVPDTRRDRQFRVIDPSVRSVMVVPLTVHGNTLGALGIDSTLPNTFEAGHERMLNIAGGQIAATIETIHLLEQSRERADDLVTANRVLQEQDELRQELVHQVSHDLRSPLQLVYGYAEMLSQGMLGDMNEAQIDVLDKMMTRAHAIEMITRDIMAAKNISRDMLDLQPVELNALCQQAVIDLKLLNENRPELHFETALAPGKLLIEADYVRLSRVLDNLLGNAAKFSPEGGLITLRTERSYQLETGKDCAVIRISDQGIGIPTDKIPFIFESFYRVQKKTFEGSGLGLYIVQQIVNAHYGAIQVESELGVGSTFIVTLPLLAEGE
ncbi:MAG: GAF domain-containing protein [Anaerolineae bacterium]|nr:GAF domain-containing protein [Anaerolineae bacterium]